MPIHIPLEDDYDAWKGMRRDTAQIGMSIVARVDEPIPERLAIGVSNQIDIYLLPRHATSRQRSAWLVNLAALGSSTDTDLDRWTNYGLSLLAAVDPDSTAAYHETNHILLHVFTDNQLKQLDALYDSCQATGDVAHEGADVLATAGDYISNQLLDCPHLPPVTATALYLLTDSLNIHVIYGWAGMALYLFGKQIGQQNRSAITERRPAALIGKYGLPAQVSILNGTLQMSSAAHRGLNSVLTRCMYARRPFVTFLTRVNSRNSTATSHDAMRTTLALLHGMGLGHIMAIMDFQQAFPKYASLDMLRPELIYFANYISVLNALSEEDRMYAKLLYGDSNGGLNRKQFDTLFAISICVLRTKYATYRNYAIPKNMGPAYQTFKQVAARAGLPVDFLPDNIDITPAVVGRDDIVRDPIRLENEMEGNTGTDNLENREAQHPPVENQELPIQPEHPQHQENTQQQNAGQQATPAEVNPVVQPDPAA